MRDCLAVQVQCVRKKERVGLQIAERRAAPCGHVGNMHGRQSRTVLESVFPDRCHVARYGDLRQGGTAQKRALADARHTAADRHVPQRSQVGKQFFSDLPYAVADDDGFKPRAALKRVVADRRHAVGYRDLRQFRAIGKGMRTDAPRTLRQRHGRKVRAPFEHVIVDLGHAAEDRHAGQRRAIPKRGRTYVRHGAPDRNVRQFLALKERPRRDDPGIRVSSAARNIPVKGAHQHQARVLLVAEVKSVVIDIAEQGGAARDRIHVHAGHVVPERNVRQAVAHAKRPVGNVAARHRDRRQRRGQHKIDGVGRCVVLANVLRRVNAGVVVVCSEYGAERVLIFAFIGRAGLQADKRQRDMFQVRTAAERTRGDADDAVRHHHVGQARAALKGIFPYVGHTVA